MPSATWKNQQIAATEKFETVEGNVYFPKDAVKAEFLRPSTTTSHCPWKGEASYYDVVVNGEVNKDAAWYYPTPKDAAKNITGHVAFWKGVTVTK